MSFDNPLEIILSIVLILGSIWIIERIIRGAVKTVIFACVLYLILAFFTAHNHKRKHEKPLPGFTAQDLLDYERFSKKFKLYEDRTINDIKSTYAELKSGK